MTTADLALPMTHSDPASSNMQALVFRGPGKPAWEVKPRPSLQHESDAIVRITTSTICGTDLHILKGDLPAVSDGRILGHEGDLDDKRLAVAKQFGATATINSDDGRAAERVMEMTDGAGVDVAIEAVGLPETFDICQAIVTAGGRIANVGVHSKPVTLRMEKLWDRNISLTTRPVDTVTTPMLLKIVASGKLQPHKLVTHSFAMEDILRAYDTFGNAGKNGALKVVLKNAGASPNK